MTREPAAGTVLAAHNVTKRFPGVVANSNVDFDLLEGEIHCLLGENGAGKTTLMNVMYGLYQPDEGEVLVRGEPVRFGSSADAIAAGIGMVHQHFQLIPVLSVVENVTLGDEIRRGPFLDVGAARDRIREISSRYGLEVDPDAKVGDLSVGQQQRVELVKALFREADILILDEPTAVLTPGEVDEFFDVVRGLVERGKSIVFITHKLREVLAVADRITVLRGGEIVGTADPSEATQQSLATMMVGRDVSFEVEKPPLRTAGVVLAVDGIEVTDDRGVTMVSDLRFDVRAGEIFGIAGVEGNGQRELVEAITGLRTASTGSITIGEHDVTDLSPRDIADLGVGHVPEDREKDGLVGPFSVADNLVLNRYHHAPFSTGLFRNRNAIVTHATALAEKFDIRTPDVRNPVDQLSGGNKQKVIVARELSGELKLLVAAQPTRGLDVGSIEFIHRQLVELRSAGVAVLLVSAELDEIMNLADRIGVIYRGRLLATLDRAEATRDRVGLLMAGGGGEDAHGRGADQTTADPGASKLGEEAEAL